MVLVVNGRAWGRKVLDWSPPKKQISRMLTSGGLSASFGILVLAGIFCFAACTRTSHGSLFFMTHHGWTESVSPVEFSTNLGPLTATPYEPKPDLGHHLGLGRSRHMRNLCNANYPRHFLKLVKSLGGQLPQSKSVSYGIKLPPPAPSCSLMRCVATR